MARVRSMEDDPLPTQGVHGGIYEDGPYSVVLVKLDGARSSCCLSEHMSAAAPETEEAEANRPPKPLLVVFPKEGGQYPVVQFQHGWSLQNAFYSQLISHIASHGFIVVAPQMTKFLAGPDATKEIAKAVEIFNWMPENLSGAMPRTFANHSPNFDKVTLIGHSRGGKVVFGVALALAKHPYAAIIGLDPVDGASVGKQTRPPILQLPPKESALALPVPTLIIGTGLGPKPRAKLLPPCAPDGVNHINFYLESAPYAVHLVGSQQGHMDFLDDDCDGARGGLSYCMCKNGPQRAPMRRFSGGVVVAFLKAVLDGEKAQLEDVLLHPELAPIPLERPEWKGSLPELLFKRKAAAAHPAVVTQ